MLSENLHNFDKQYYVFQAARISNTLSLQSRCSSILALLANSAISQPPNGKILSTHALSLDILITGMHFLRNIFLNFLNLK